MPLPVEQFPLLNPSQISPMMTGIGEANALYQQTMQNQYLQPMLQQQLRREQLSNQVLQANANVAPQMTQAQLAYMQAKTPNLNAATQYVLSGQLPTSMAQAGLIGTEAQKNQFVLQHPELMLPGIASQVGSIALLRQLMPAEFGENQVAPPTQNQMVSSDLNYGKPVGLPGMPSAGEMTSPTQTSSAPLLPQNTYGSAGAPAAGISGFPSTNELSNLLVKGMLAPMQEKIAQANYYQSRAQGYNFSILPPQEKSYMIAQAAGMGYEPLVAANLLNSGQTLASLAQEKGLDPNNLPSPIYPAGTGTIQLIQKINQALTEINTIQPEITSALSPYSRRFSGFSPSQIAGAISNDNPDMQARYLAAKALMPEMASLRLKAMGGNIGIEAIREVNDASMGNIKSFQGLVNPKVYTAAQNYIDQWINQGANAANRVGLAGTLKNTGGINPSQLGSTNINAMVTMRAPNGEQFQIPASNVQRALSMGATQL